MRKLKIYLSGAITGRENYKEEFEYAKIRIKDFEAKNNKKTDKDKIKLDVIVPHHYDYLNKTGKWEDYLKNDIKMLVDCDCLIDIENGSENSKGAMLEKMICIALGIPIVSLSSFLYGYPIYRYTTTRLYIK
ncbi:DUF4406 domain-containing protein [Brachyspira pilosicoli]|uniref:DUF4406 domain-containing protein n=1 Tax=Brachyspira pilosicoli TaxID=52584 RepID=UPI0012F488B0|nr:DUF4406 domain-containing protein [Brachyspira pilosicoli]